MEFNLCNIFKVKEGKHFWIEYKDSKCLDECYIKNNELWSICGDLTGIVQRLDIFSINKIHYKKPIQLTENTRAFLKLVRKAYEYIARDKNGKINLYIDKPEKSQHLVYDIWVCEDPCVEITKIEMALNINLSFVKWEDNEPTKISDLLEGDNQ